MFVYEKENTLVLASGIPDDWFTHKDGFSMRNAPTWFGTINLSVTPEKDGITIKVTGDAQPDDGFKLIIPEHLAENVYVNNEKVLPPGGELSEEI